MEYNKLDPMFSKLELRIIDFEYDNLFLFYRDGRYLGIGVKGENMPKTEKTKNRKKDIFIKRISFVDRDSGKLEVLETMYEFEEMLKSGIGIVPITEYNLDVIICLTSIFQIIINPVNAIIRKKEETEEIKKYIKKIKKENDFNSKSFNLIKKKLFK